MRDLNTISELKLLLYARQELSRRINALKDEIARGSTTQSLKRTESVLAIYSAQMEELVCRIAELNNMEQ